MMARNKDHPADQLAGTAHEPKLDLANLAEIGAWIAASAASGVIGSATFAYMNSFRRRFDEGRIDKLKTQVYDELKRVKRKPDVSDADLRLRLDRLFRDHSAD